MIIHEGVQYDGYCDENGNEIVIESAKEEKQIAELANELGIGLVGSFKAVQEQMIEEGTIVKQKTDEDIYLESYRAMRQKDAERTGESYTPGLFQEMERIGKTMTDARDYGECFFDEPIVITEADTNTANILEYSVMEDGDISITEDSMQLIIEGRVTINEPLIEMVQEDIKQRKEFLETMKNDYERAERTFNGSARIAKGGQTFEEYLESQQQGIDEREVVLEQMLSQQSGDVIQEDGELKPSFVSLIKNEKFAKWEIKDKQIIIPTDVTVQDRKDRKKGNDKTYTITKDTILTGVKCFAGKGSQNDRNDKQFRALDAAPELVEKFGGEESDWAKYESFCNIPKDDVLQRVQLNWFYNDELGAIGRDIKYWKGVVQNKDDEKGDIKMEYVSKGLSDFDKWMDRIHDMDENDEESTDPNDKDVLKYKNIPQQIQSIKQKYVQRGTAVAERSGREIVTEQQLPMSVEDADRVKELETIYNEYQAECKVLDNEETGDDKIINQFGDVVGRTSRFDNN